MSGTSETNTVAVLGCGLMGSAVARALSRGGYDLVVWNRSRAKADALAGPGVRAEVSALDAVRAAPTVFSVVSDVAALREALGDHPPLEGRTLVNLTTGSPAQVRDLEAWVSARGGNYLDGMIAAYPGDIGTEDCVIYYAGPQALYRDVEPVLRAVGGSPRFVSEAVDSAEVIDVGLVGMFVMPALAAYAEAIAYMTDHGVGVDLLRRALERDLGILQHQMEDVLSAVESGNHETDQATVDTYAIAADVFLDEARAVGCGARLLSAAIDVFGDVRRAGKGHLGMSAIAALGGEGD